MIVGEYNYLQSSALILEQELTLLLVDEKDHFNYLPLKQEIRYLSIIRFKLDP